MNSFKSGDGTGTGDGNIIPMPVIPAIPGTYGLAPLSPHMKEQGDAPLSIADFSYIPILAWSSDFAVFNDPASQDSSQETSGPDGTGGADEDDIHQIPGSDGISAIPLQTETGEIVRSNKVDKTGNVLSFEQARSKTGGKRTYEDALKEEKAKRLGQSGQMGQGTGGGQMSGSLGAGYGLVATTPIVNAWHQHEVPHIIAYLLLDGRICQLDPLVYYPTIDAWLKSLNPTGSTETTTSESNGTEEPVSETGESGETSKSGETGDEGEKET